MAQAAQSPGSSRYNSAVPEPQLPPPVVITQPGELAAMVSRLSGRPRIAVDTESNSLYAYRERVCLIQFSYPGVDYLVDPLALADLASLASIFADPAVEKVFHAAEYDLICLKRDYGFGCACLFDTRVASRTLGWPQDGLGDLLSQQFGLQLNKRFQRADWGQRPLPPALLDYARLDTHYLLALRDKLAEALHAAGRWEMAREEFLRLEQIDAHSNGFDPTGFWRIPNARQLEPQRAGVLQELYSLREQLARQADRPPFKILGDKTLMAVAQTLPTTPAELAGLPGMTERQIHKHGASLIEAVARGRQSPPARPPQAERADDVVLERYERLRLWRKHAAEATGVESDVILPREVVWEIARQAPRNAQDLRRVMAPLEWRFETYRRDLLRLLWG